MDGMCEHPGIPELGSTSLSSASSLLTSLHRAHHLTPHTGFSTCMQNAKPKTGTHSMYTRSITRDYGPCAQEETLSAPQFFSHLHIYVTQSQLKRSFTGELSDTSLIYIMDFRHYTHSSSQLIHLSFFSCPVQNLSVEEHLF